VDLGLNGKVVLVTGAARGIGRATVVAFAREGARVVASDRRAENGAETMRLLRESGGEGTFVEADVTRDADVQEMVNAAVSEYGRLDCAINNAGIAQAEKPVHEMTEEEFDALIAVNVKGTWLSMKHEIPVMLRGGGGSVVNVSSVAGLTATAGQSVYAATKHAILGLTRGAALDYATQGIRVNSIHPAAIDTPMIRDFVRASGGDERVMEPIRAAHPMGRIGTAEEVAAAIVWLSSDVASFTTGSPLLVDGGWVAH
jgi:NAD(P)-dependent dehydrogenase (short-subunit alcohol dehydrogenase family)